MRIVAREMVFQLVFEYSFWGVENLSTLEMITVGNDLTEDDKQYIKSTYEGVIAHFPELEQEVASYLENYTLDRISRPERCVLVLAAYELKYGDAPYAAVVNAAVTIAKRFGREQSGRFVNGVLAKMLKGMNLV